MVVLFSQKQVLKDFTEKKEPEKVNGDRKNEKM